MFEEHIYLSILLWLKGLGHLLSDSFFGLKKIRVENKKKINKNILRIVILIVFGRKLKACFLFFF